MLKQTELYEKDIVKIICIAKIYVVIHILLLRMKRIEIYLNWTRITKETGISHPFLVV